MYSGLAYEVETVIPIRIDKWMKMVTNQLAVSL